MYEEVMPGIYRLGVPLPENPLKELNSYLIRGTRNLLIDTGFRREECRNALVQCLKELNVSMEETDIYITHCHSDHAGLAPDVASSSTHVWVSETDRDWLLPETRFALNDQVAVRFRTSGISSEELDSIYKTHPGLSLSPDKNFSRYEPLPDGHILEAGDYRLKVIFTPGHTPGNTCLWDEEKHLMFTGDHVLFDITPNITFWTNVDDSLGNYLDNLRKVRDYPVKTALPGHRKQGDFHARVDALLAHHEYRLNECHKVVEEMPALTPYEIAGHMTWRVRARDWASFPVAQRWFAVGECMSHLDYLKKRGKVRFETDGNGVDHYFAV